MPTISHDLLLLKNSHKTAIKRHHYTVSVKRNCTLKNILKKITVILILKWFHCQFLKITQKKKFKKFRNNFKFFPALSFEAPSKVFKTKINYKKR